MSTESTGSLTLTEILNKQKKILKTLRAKRRAMLKIIELRMSKPEFLRNLWWKFAKFENNLKWKKPRGKDNPMRLCLKGYPPIVRSGYGTPKEFRDVHPSGFKIAVIRNARDLDKLNPSEYIVYISSTVGLKKRLELISLAKAKGFRIANE
ncbi:MAG: 50S ribosomal protein L32e [Desulfurococcaceae archaeon]|jgi:large subunit ribosomal protein L32e|nr:50S ribosomal protein L32e [Desulfurococcaceae archaeon]